MNLWKKTLLVIAVSVAVLSLTLFVLQRVLVLGSFSLLESQYARLDVTRATQAFDAEQQRLDVLANGWAAWDDTYRFVQEHDAAYLESNLGDNALLDARINLLLIVDNSARIVFARALDLTTRKAVLIPEFSQEAITPEHPLLQHPDVTSQVGGVLLLESGPMLIVSRPIRTSEGQGPVRGTLLVGRFIDAALVEQVSTLVQRPLVVWRIDDPALPVEFRQARAQIQPGQSVVHPLDAQHVASYALLNDLAGNPALIIRTELPRDIYQYGVAIFRYLAAAIVLVGTAFWGVIVLLLERTVLSRVNELGRQVSRLGEAKDLSARVTLPGDDELGRLAGRINRTLSDLQQAKESIRWRERYLEGLSQAAQSLLTLDSEIRYEAFLRPLGEATRASRVCVFLNERGLGGELQTSLHAEWCAEGVHPLSGDPKWVGLPYMTGGLGRWMHVLQRGDAITGLVSDFPAAEQNLLQASGTQALVALPMEVDGSFAGFITFDQCSEPREWEPAEIDLVRTAAADLALALKRQRDEKVRRATYRVSEAAHSTQNLGEFFRSIHAIVRELMPAKALTIALCGPEGKQLDFLYSADENGGRVEPQGLERELTEYVARTGESTLIPLNVYEKLKEQGAGQSIQVPSMDWLGVPLKVGDRIIGVLGVHSYAEGARFGAAEQDILTFISAQMAMAVERLAGAS